MQNKVIKPELLLPCGGMESVIAAVQNGADAIYLGGKLFSARQNAENFDETALAEAVRYCKIRGVKVYQTLNTLLFDDQLATAAEAIALACRVGVDAIIVQDWGIVKLIREIAPDMPIHGSTQMTVHSPEGAKLMKEAGLSRVVLAREMSLDEIREINETVDIETEVFIHGALCMSVSGQCYVSGMLGTRSGNRGACAGTCRLPFSFKGKKEEYALSLKDLCAKQQLKALAEIGVSSLKIEGRMKRPEYVAAAAAAYRKELDEQAGDFDTLRAVFSRSGFTDAYLTGERGRSLFGTRQKEDVVSATEKLFKSLRNTYKDENGRIPLDMHLTIRSNEAVTLSASDGVYSASCSGEIPEVAQNRPTTEESAVRVLAKLGGTIFTAGRITTEIEDGLIVPVSALNALRRQICDEITEKRGEFAVPSCGERLPLPTDHAQFVGKPALYARFASFDQLSEEALMLCDRFSLPLHEVLRHTDELLAHKKRMMIELPRLLFGREARVKEQLASLREIGFSAAVCENIAHIGIAKPLGMELIGGAYLNCSNSFNAAWLKEQGLSALTLSFEMSARDISRIRTDIPRGMIACGTLPLMLYRSCPGKNEGGCKTCKGDKMLTDRYGKRFPLFCMKPDGSALLNSTMLWTADKQRDFSGVAFTTCYFTKESASRCAALLGMQLANAKYDGEFTRGLYYRSV